MESLVTGEVFLKWLKLTTAVQEHLKVQTKPLKRGFQSFTQQGVYTN